MSPPPPPGQERKNSPSYWKDEYRNGSGGEIYSEQITPFIGYQPPPVSSSRRHQENNQKQSRPQRPLSLTSDTEYGFAMRVPLDRKQKWKEKRVAGCGARRSSGLNQISRQEVGGGRTSSERVENERISIDVEERQTKVPDRLARAKEWVANHSKSDNNIIAPPMPIANHTNRYSTDPEEYGLISPPQVSFMSNPEGIYDSRERMVMATRMRTQNQGQRGYRHSMVDDGQYWDRQMEGYEYDRYRQTRQEYEYIPPSSGTGAGGGYYSHVPGGPDDVDEGDIESTLAPGSAAGVNLPKKGTEKPTDKFPDMVDHSDLEDQLGKPKAPNRKRMILRLISLSSSLLVLILLIAAKPVSHYEWLLYLMF
jgi:hypothetical protein